MNKPCYNKLMHLPSNTLFEKLRQKHQLNLILLHGSQVSGKFIHANSDVDIAVYGSQNSFNLLNFSNDVEEILPEQKIDIADITHADPLFLYTVVSRSKLLAGSEVDYQKLKTKASHRYRNYQPYLEKERQFVIERLNSYVAT